MTDELMSSNVNMPEEVQMALANNQTIQRTNMNFVQMIGIPKPRDWNKVENAALREAAIAGDEFYYSWKQGGSIVEGLTIGAAISLFRSLGNGYTTAVVANETKDAYYINGVYIDIENNIVIERPYKQSKESKKTKDGKDIYQGSRGDSVLFSIGVSKAMRNAILSAVPKWLIKKVMHKAKEGITNKIEKMGVVKAQEYAVKKLEALKIPLVRVESVFGKVKAWDTVKLVSISSAITAIENGYESADELFPLTQEEKLKAIEDSTPNVTISNVTTNKTENSEDKQKTKIKITKPEPKVTIPDLPEEVPTEELDKLSEQMDEIEPNNFSNDLNEHHEEIRLALLEREPSNYETLEESCLACNTRVEYAAFRGKYQKTISSIYLSNKDEVTKLFNELNKKFD